MLPASDQTGAAKSRQLKRWGPIIGIVAVAAIVIGIVASSGDDKKTATPTTTTTAPAASTTASASTSAGATTTKGAPAPITYPLRFSEAKAKGITIRAYGLTESEVSISSISFSSLARNRSTKRSAF